MFSGGIGFLMFSWGIEKDHWQKWVNKSSWRRSLQEFVAESAPPFIPICLIISVFQYFEECEHLQEMGRVNVQNPQLSQRLATIIFLTFRSLYPKKKKKLLSPFYGWGSTGSRLQPLRGATAITFPEIPDPWVALCYAYNLNPIQDKHFSGCSCLWR